MKTMRPLSVVAVVGSSGSGSASSAMVKVPPFLTGRLSAAAPGTVGGEDAVPLPEHAAARTSGSTAKAAARLRVRMGAGSPLGGAGTRSDVVEGAGGRALKLKTVYWTRFPEMSCFSRGDLVPSAIVTNVRPGARAPIASAESGVTYSDRLNSGRMRTAIGARVG